MRQAPAGRALADTRAPPSPPGRRRIWSLPEGQEIPQTRLLQSDAPSADQSPSRENYNIDLLKGKSQHTTSVIQYKTSCFSKQKVTMAIETAIWIIKPSLQLEFPNNKQFLQNQEGHFTQNNHHFFQNNYIHASSNEQLKYPVTLFFRRTTVSSRSNNWLIWVQKNL